MAGCQTPNRMRVPLMTAFRSAFESHDSKRTLHEHDELGERVVAGRRTTGRSTMSESSLQRAVSDDLEILMNTTHLESSEDIAAFDEVRGSILNYGIPDVTHRTIDEDGVHEVEGELVVALSRFEPRLEPATIRVRQDTRPDKSELRVRFVIQADLRCDPLNLPVEFVADVESEGGKISVIGR